MKGDRPSDLIGKLHDVLSTNELDSQDLNDLKLELEALRDRVTAHRNRLLIAETKKILKM